MKNSEIFWNSLVILAEIIIGLIWFQSDFKEFCFGILVIHSLLLLGCVLDGDDPIPFLFISFFGLGILIFFGFLFGVFWIIDNNLFKGFNLGITDRIDKFNDFLNRKK